MVPRPGFERFNVAINRLAVEEERRVCLQINLYKFVRLAGDLLTPPLFVPYVDMLTGLANGPQSAHHCFNLLKTNGASGECNCFYSGRETPARHQDFGIPIFSFTFSRIKMATVRIINQTT